VEKGNQVFMRDLGLGLFRKVRTPGAHLGGKIVINWEAICWRFTLGAHLQALKAIIFCVPEYYVCAPGVRTANLNI